MGNKYNNSKIRFQKSYQPISLSLHSITRLKKRINLKSKEKRNRFIRGAARNGLLLSNIPKIDKFKPFLSYMSKMYKKNSKRNPFCKLYVYKEYILVVSIEGVIVTVLNIPEEYNGVYDKIVSYNNQNPWTLTFQ